MKTKNDAISIHISRYMKFFTNTVYDSELVIFKKTTCQNSYAR